MVLIGVGSILLAIGALRALQTETGSTFTGSLSWAPYGIVLAGALVVLGAVGDLIMRGKKSWPPTRSPVTTSRPSADRRRGTAQTPPRRPSPKPPPPPPPHHAPH